MRRLLPLLFALSLLARGALASTIDGDGAFHGSATTANTATHFVGRQAATITQTSEDAFWVTPIALTDVQGSVFVSAAPGAAASGKSWDVHLLYMPSSLTSSQGCADIIGSLSDTGTICTISETAKQCNFTSTPSGGIAANSCLQIKLVANNTPLTTSGGTQVSFSATDANSDTPAFFAHTDVNSRTVTHFLGPQVSTTSADNTTYWVAPFAIAAGRGVVAIDTPPGVGNTWTLSVDVSTAALTGTQVCTDLTYTSVSIGTISGATQQELDFDWSTSVTVAAGGCFRYVMTRTTAAATGTGGIDYTLATSTDAGSPHTGGAMMWSGFTATISASLFGGRIVNASNVLGSHVIAPYDLSTCSGTISLGTTPSAGTWDVTLLDTGNALCTVGTPVTETATLCQINTSTNTHTCSFTGASFAATLGHCITLHAARNGHTSASGTVSLSVNCAEAVATVTPTPTPTTTPTPTGPTPTPTPTATHTFVPCGFAAFPARCAADGSCVGAGCTCQPDVDAGLCACVCPATPTATPTVTATPTLTPTPTATGITATPTPTATTTPVCCTGGPDAGRLCTDIGCNCLDMVCIQNGVNSHACDGRGPSYCTITADCPPGETCVFGNVCSGPVCTIASDCISTCPDGACNGVCPTPHASPTPTPTSTAGTPTVTPTVTVTLTPTRTATRTPTPIRTPTPTVTCPFPTPCFAGNSACIETPLPTDTPTRTPTPTKTRTPTPTVTSTP